MKVEVLPPTWRKVFSHYKEADFLLDWINSLDKWPTPYLFFYGPPYSGKSIFHQALSLLVPIVHIDEALIGIFNKELERADICVVEYATNKEKIKEWATSETILIRPQCEKSYYIKNKTHWIHNSLYLSDCPDIPNVVKIRTEKIRNPIPKRELMERLRKEIS